MRTSQLASIAAFAIGCSSTPAPPPAEPAPPAPTASPSATPAQAGPRAPTTKVLGSIGDVTVASYPPTGFDKLTPQQRVLAYHLTQAVLAGDPLFTMQTSRH